VPIRGGQASKNESSNDYFSVSFYVNGTNEQLQISISGTAVYVKDLELEI